MIFGRKNTKNLQKQEKKFNNEYACFKKALSNFNVKAYFASNNKVAYLNNCSNYCNECDDEKCYSCSNSLSST